MENLIKHYRKTETVKYFKEIHSNSKLKHTLSVGIDLILKEIYEPINRWGSKTDENGEVSYGVMDITPTGELVWGKINTLNTNYSAHTFLMDAINKLCLDEGIEVKLSFDDVGESYYKAITFIRKMIRLLKQFSHIIFDENGECYQILIEILKNTWGVGLKYSDNFKENYKTYFPTSTRIETTGDERGNFNDMVDGVDVYVFFMVKSEEVKKSVQIKGATCYFVGDKYKVDVGMDLQKYASVWAFAFFDIQHKQIYIFKNDVSEIEQISTENGPAFLFPANLFYKKFDYKDE